MKLYPIPYEFIEKHVSFSWHDLDYGYRRGFITIDSFIKFATHEIEFSKIDSDEVIQLAAATANQVYFVEKLVDKIKSTINSCNEHESLEATKWLNLSLLWVYKNKESFNLQEVIDGIYADFDYPSQIKHLISYMPHEGEPKSIEQELYCFLRNSNLI